MTEEFKQAVCTYVDARNKLARAINSVDRNNIEKLKMLSKLAEPIVKQRDEAKATLFEMVKSETATEEEIIWFESMMQIATKK